MSQMVTPADTVIGPIQDQLCLVAQQIVGIDPQLCFSKPPRGPLQEGSVLFPFKRVDVDSATTGKLRLRLTFQALHIFRMRPLEEVIPDMQAYFPAWWNVLSAWSNQTLGGKAISLDFSEGDIQTLRHNGSEYLALSHTLTVLTSFKVNTQP